MFLWFHNKYWIRQFRLFFYFLHLPSDRGANEQQIGAKDKPQEAGWSNQISLETLSTEQSVPKEKMLLILR